MNQETPENQNPPEEKKPGIHINVEFDRPEKKEASSDYRIQDLKVSVVVVSYNTGPILFRTIESVLRQEGLHELVLVDNGNHPGIVAKLKRISVEDARFKLITGHGNIGFASGCNLGVKYATGEYLLFLNPDCILPKLAIRAMAENLAARPEAWLAGGCMINPDGTLQGGSKRNLLTPLIAVAEAFKLSLIIRENPNLRLNLVESENERTASFVPAISGAMMMLKKTHYELVGGLDEDYFFHVEDLDFCRQITEKGGKILYVPSVRVVHFRSTSEVPQIFVERCKTKGFIHYFRKFYSSPPGMILPLLGAIYLRLLLRAAPIIVIGHIRKLKEERKQHFAARRVELLEKKTDFLPALETGKESLLEAGPVIVTGATGQVGLAVLRKLLHMQVDCVALYHKNVIDFSHPKLSWVIGDLSTEFLNLEGLNAKTLIHTPPIWMLPKNIYKFSNAGVRRLICFSSTSIVGKSNSKNLYEQDLVKKYAKAEQEIAKLCSQLGIQWTILRPTMIYGYGLDQNLSQIARFIENFGYFPVNGGVGLRQPVHVDDLADAVLSILNLRSTFSRTYNLGGGSKHTYRDMIRKIYFALDKRERIVNISFLPALLNMFSMLTGRADINGEIARRMNQDLVFDDSEARHDFKYNPRTFLYGGAEDLAMDNLRFEVKR